VGKRDKMNNGSFHITLLNIRNDMQPACRSSLGIGRKKVLNDGNIDALLPYALSKHANELKVDI